MIMFILAGGYGTRLLGAVSDVPKPMAPVNGVPFLKLQLDNWIQQGQKSFVFLLHHQAELIITFLKEQIELFDSKVSISWIVEEKALGTGGSIANAISKLDLSGYVLIANADTWLDSGPNIISGSDGPKIGLVEVEDASRYGLVEVDRSGIVTGFIEKTHKSISGSLSTINAGIYKLPTNIFKYKKDQVFSLEAEVLPELVDNRLLYADYLSSNFFDIGVPEDYYKFCDWHKNLMEKISCG
jgi:D-glycero-alpha-D-manno-heptose 1-phosphate guanylyltransferase